MAQGRHKLYPMKSLVYPLCLVDSNANQLKTVAMFCLTLFPSLIYPSSMVTYDNIPVECFSMDDLLPVTESVFPNTAN